jgi:hypothetical protein
MDDLCVKNKTGIRGRRLNAILFYTFQRLGMVSRIRKLPSSNQTGIKSLFRNQCTTRANLRNLYETCLQVTHTVFVLYVHQSSLRQFSLVRTPSATEDNTLPPLAHHDRPLLLIGSTRYLVRKDSRYLLRARPSTISLSFYPVVGY